MFKNMTTKLTGCRVSSCNINGVAVDCTTNIKFAHLVLHSSPTSQFSLISNQHPSLASRSAATSSAKVVIPADQVMR